MTRAEWLEGTDARLMLEAVRGKVSERKLRLFVCACCRRYWGRLDALHREAVEAAERYADGRATRRELAALDDAIVSQLAEAPAKRHPLFAAAHDAVAVPARGDDLGGYAPVAEGASYSVSAYAPELDQAALLRCLCGDPFRDTPLVAAWLSWNDGTVPKIAQEVYDGRSLPAGTLDRARLAVLADALQDAGCDDADVLAHCRSAGEHVRGCWVVDLLLGKS
jgi:hypothetical protein